MRLRRFAGLCLVVCVSSACGLKPVRFRDASQEATSGDATSDAGLAPEDGRDDGRFDAALGDAQSDATPSDADEATSNALDVSDVSDVSDAGLLTDSASDALDASGTDERGAEASVDAGPTADVPDAAACDAGACGDPGPRLVAPLSGQRWSGRRLPVRWSLQDPSHRAQLRFASTREALASATPSLVVDAPAGSTDAVVTLPTAGRWYGRLVECAGACVAGATLAMTPVVSLRVQSVAGVTNDARLASTEFDGDGDGFGDLGANGQHGTVGTTSVFAGRAARPAPMTSFAGAATLEAPDARLAPAGMSAAGDANGDGFGDAVVAYDASAFAEGERSPRLYLHRSLGAALGLAPTGVPVAYPTAGTTIGSVTLAPLGDVNGDGYADLAVGATPLSHLLPTRVSVLAGGPGGYAAEPLSILTSTDGDGASTNDSFAFPAFLGSVDLDGDGLSDLVIPASGAGPTSATTRLPAGRVDVFFHSGNPAAPYAYPRAGATGRGAFVRLGGSAGQVLGRSVVVGDFDGDGCVELVASAEGTRSVRLVSFDATRTPTETELPLTAPLRYRATGRIAALDADNDGRTDLVATWSLTTGQTATMRDRIDLLRGPLASAGDAEGLVAAWSFDTALLAGGYFGFGLALRGGNDFDGDGRDDLLVSLLGTPSFDLLLFYGDGAALASPVVVRSGLEGRVGYGFASQLAF